MGIFKAATREAVLRAVFGALLLWLSWVFISDEIRHPSWMHPNGPLNPWILGYLLQAILIFWACYNLRPLRVVCKARAAASQKTSVLNESAPADGASILLLDDFPEGGTNIELLEEVLGQSGCQVRIARTGGAALEAALESPPDLVILCTLQAQGAHFCATLAANARTSSVPVLVLTSGLSRKAKEFEAESLPNVAGVLRKPFELDELKASVLDILGKKRT